MSEEIIDIVLRLKLRCSCHETEHRFMCIKCEAADFIERLRAENTQLFEANQKLASAMTEFYNLPPKPSSQTQES